MNLAQLVCNTSSDTFRSSSPSYTQSSSISRNKRQAPPLELPPLSTVNLYLDRRASAISKSPQAPLSPPEEPTKYSLPPISSLLQTADNISHIHVAKRQRPNPLPHSDLGRCSPSYGQNKGPIQREKVILPPTPPLRPGSVFDGKRHSPSSSSAHSPISVASLTNNGYTGNTEASLHRKISLESLPPHSSRSSISQISPVSLPDRPHTSSSSATSGPFISPVEPPTNSLDFYRRKSHLPFPQISDPMSPGTQPLSHLIVSLGSPAWQQHHHYFPPSNASPYPQNHDRYICRTCHKAFSRPSSLRIHSHSHTGEKPFRCPQAGCGKAFSVRSNMKRHERGCHTSKATQSAMVN
ncbi:hypothetical protein AJ80_06339 [Polytolypa hystricis UAMH7299]|uniref:C2H2-type domain-containing protein n=1 Tax=Polytolypa hystricis (strain UAMH7299) TaxID=1447883 RepID=A0A2B7XXZ1_POLH7|nr:hypothetical protein AJ80_06339 [Polytolypa hystricis UAMH7299]